MSDNALKQISDHGQSIWYDNIERSLLNDGKLAQLVAEDHIVGVTSNPSIFEKAISGSDAYDAQIEEVVSQNPTIPIKDLYEALAIEDRNICSKRCTKDLKQVMTLCFIERNRLPQPKAIMSNCSTIVSVFARSQRRTCHSLCLQKIVEILE